MSVLTNAWLWFLIFAAMGAGLGAYGMVIRPRAVPALLSWFCWLLAGTIIPSLN